MSAPDLTYEQTATHVGRSFGGHPIEDECPCVKEPCGLVRIDDANPACEHHPPERLKTMRQGHAAHRCPHEPTAREAKGRRWYDLVTADNAEAAHWRELSEEDRQTWIASAPQPERAATS